MKLNFKDYTFPDYIDMYLEDTKENTFKKITDGFEINFDEAYEGLGSSTCTLQSINPRTSN